MTVFAVFRDKEIIPKWNKKISAYNAAADCARVELHEANWTRACTEMRHRGNDFALVAVSPQKICKEKASHDELLSPNRNIVDFE